MSIGVWRMCVDLAESPIAKCYFESRGLDVPNTEGIRFHPSLMHHPTNTRHPTLVTIVRDLDGNPLGIHRTYLAPNGRGKAAATPARMFLGSFETGAAQLVDAGRTLLLGEGLETVLAAMQATGIPGWAALSASRMAHVDLPAIVDELIVLADHDQAGIAAARKTARRWTEGGMRVRVATPPTAGTDFADLLKREA